MSHAAAEKAGALVLFLALAVPSVSQATLADFGAAGGGSNLSDVNEIPETAPTALTLFFETSGTDGYPGVCDDSGPGCIFGWTGTLTTTGDLRITGYDPSGNANTASGSGETNCDISFLPASSCMTNGGDDAKGEVGAGIVMFSVTVSGGSIGDQLLWDGDFTKSDFSAIDADRVIATVIPEPTTLLLLGSGLAGLALVGRNRSA